MDSNQQWTRVILLVSPGHGRELSESIQSQFAARDWFAIQVNDPYLAMTELCLREKAQKSRAAWGLQRLEKIGLVVLEPDDWETAGVRLIDLTTAVERSVPQASVWYLTGDRLMPVYERARSEKYPPRSTHALMAASTAKSSPNATRSYAPEASDDHALHLAHGSSILPAAARVNGEESNDRTRLTREEISMLLDPLEPTESEIA